MPSSFDELKGKKVTGCFEGGIYITGIDLSATRQHTVLGGVMPTHSRLNSGFLCAVVPMFLAAATYIMSFTMTHAAAADLLQYTLTIRIDPSTHHLTGEAVIRNPQDTCFYLNPHFEATRITSDGRPAAFQRVPDGKPMQYSVGTPVAVEGAVPREMRISYAGTIDDVINNVNMIGPDLVELAFYAAWFPVLPKSGSYEYTLVLDLPSGFTTTTNGMLKNREERGERTLTTWTSYKPTSDIAIIASPRLQLMSEERNGTAIELFFSTLPRKTMLAKRDALVTGMGRLTRLYGPPRVQGVLRFVYSPRNGWGYSRIPLFVVSEAYAQKLADEEFGQARDYHGAVHELTHFWWNIAPTNTPDDWINEGLAEYSAYCLSAETYGDAFARTLVTEYREHAAASKAGVPIAETPAESDDRYVNRYEKTTLLFIEAGRRYGRDMLEWMFRSLHEKFAGTRGLNTAVFLETVNAHMGREAEKFFKETLNSTSWTEWQTMMGGE